MFRFVACTPVHRGCYADPRGLKLRSLGLGGEVYRRLGATPQTTPPAEILTSLQSGVLDGAEFVGPGTDIALGLYRVAAEANYALAEMERLNAQALEALVKDHGVKLTAFPADIVAAAREQAHQVMTGFAVRSDITGKISGSYDDFRERTAPWSRVSIEAVLRARGV